MNRRRRALRRAVRRSRTPPLSMRAQALRALAGQVYAQSLFIWPRLPSLAITFDSLFARDVQ